jgi:sarcosine oxidase subunit beta
VTRHAVVVGAGVVGASVAYHLGRRGWRVTVLERAGEIGQGSTGRATGGYRAQFASEVNVRLSLLSREKLRGFEREHGVDCGYRPWGYLFLAHTDAQLGALRAAIEVQRASGHDETREVDCREIARLNPALSLDAIVGGTYGPTDGVIRPLEILRGYAESAARAGAHFVFDSGEIDFERDGDRIAAACARGERVRADAVVDAAGAWAAEVARRAGAALPVRPLRRQVAITRPFARLAEEMPLTIFVGDGFHLRVRDGRVLLLLPVDHETDDPFDTSFDASWLERVVEIARDRVPALRDAEVEPSRCWSGLYEMSPDKHAILGPSVEVPNFFYANGSSGHGVMHAPALGHLLAEMIDGAEPSFDVRALRPSRFDEGDPNPVAELL